MLSLTNKRILLGITGGIAAYKSAELTRLLVKAGAEVHVAMTPSATEFITPLTLQALSGHRVHLDLLDAEAEAGMGHIELARWADLIVIAPATADFMARMTHGQADDLLTSVILASTAQIAIAPAMNQAMWADGITQSNLEALQHRRIHVWGPASGEQACGDVGPGRMIEPQEIADRCAGMFETTRLTGKKVLMTGGPTREAIDPVRFISNHSTGKMGYALANEAQKRGANVQLVSGPVSLKTPENVQRIDVKSALEMKKEITKRFDKIDVLIMSAAVADYEPKKTASNKIKKQDQEICINLKKTPDILKDLAKSKKKQIVIGFALETENGIENAYEKLKRKNLDAIILNSLSDIGAGFGYDTNKVTLITPSEEREFELKSKDLVAIDILNFVEECI